MKSGLIVWFWWKIRQRKTSVERVTESLQIQLDLVQLRMKPVVCVNVKIESFCFAMHRYQMLSISG